eukprot:CAMPEP_0115023086 /NCGR_PEP_ID=MMETSP0216-20121206/32111_1 /TAXON_ID=223996 /ORGANISM="Protocruzia adherens, Strain Boccale" /LENGTH=220 /DNA_ID=CAMNT_0002396243 /DNA_START=683 /DNA_END=1346 /DNA_ORIENTATION=+
MIGERGAKILADILTINSVITTLDLHQNSARDTCAIAFAAMLRVNSSLRFLDLSNNSIGLAGAKAICDALGTNKSLECLRLCGNSLGTQGGYLLARALKQNKSIMDLCLSGGTDLGSTGVVAIGEAIKYNKTLRYLNLDGILKGESNTSIHEAQVPSLKRLKLIPQFKLSIYQVNPSLTSPCYHKSQSSLLLDQDVWSLSLDHILSDGGIRRNGKYYHRH